MQVVRLRHLKDPEGKAKRLIFTSADAPDADNWGTIQAGSKPFAVALSPAGLLPNRPSPNKHSFVTIRRCLATKIHRNQ